MDLAKKRDYLYQHIQSISLHEDEDGAVRKSLLDQAIAFIEAEKDGIDARNAARVAELGGEE